MINKNKLLGKSLTVGVIILLALTCVVGYSTIGTDINVEGILYTDTVNENTTATGVTIDGLTVKDSKLHTESNHIWEDVTDTDDQAIYINYNGYAGGITRFRDLIVDNGKNAHIAHFDGSSKETDFYGAIKTDTISEHTSATGVTVDGVELKDSGVKTAGIHIQELSIDRYSYANDDGAIIFNHNGYNGGTTYFRDLGIRDGKNANVIYVDGSSKETDFYGIIKTDTIDEHTASTGVTIDGVLIKDSLIDAKYLDVDEQSFTNLLENGDFESWSAGTSSAPDGWVLISGPTVAREGTTTKFNTYSLALTGDDYEYAEQVIPVDSFLTENNVVTASCWVKSTSDKTTLSFYVNSSDVYHSYHTGSGDWELLTITKTLTSPTAFSVLLYPKRAETGDTTAYYDGLNIVMGSVCPAFSPKPLPDDGKTLQIDSANNAVLCDTINESTSATGVTIDRLEIKDQGVKTSSIHLSTNKIEDYLTAADSGAIYINHGGYNGGTDYFRDLYIRDGKNNNTLTIDGSSKTANFYGTIKTDTISEHTGASGVTIDSLEIKDEGLKTDSLHLTGSSLYNYGDNTDAGVININYKGYDSGTTKFRDVDIFDGKNAHVLYVDGSSKEADFYGTVKTDTISEHTAYGGVTVEKLTIEDNFINREDSATNDARIVINHAGYDGGSTYFRDFYIEDGKENSVIFVDGSAKTIDFNGTVKTDTISESTAATGVTVDGLEIKDSGLKTANLHITGPYISEYSTNGLAAIVFNAIGYNGGTTQFRNLYIQDGKGAGIVDFWGGLKISDFYGTIQTDDIVEHTVGNGVLIEAINIIDNRLEIPSGNSDNITMTINKYGYDSGVTKFRDVIIKDGKNADVLYVDGSSKETDFYGTIKTDVINSHTADAAVVIKELSIGDRSEVTISNDNITITTGYHTVDTEGDASTDDLVDINGGESGQVLVLRSASSSRDITLKDQTGNLYLAGDFNFTATVDTITLIGDGTNWVELSRSDNS